MNQSHRMFNSYRRPGHPLDSIRLHFATEAEGDCPSHMVVLCKGHLWRLPMLGKDGEAANPSQFGVSFELLSGFYFVDDATETDSSGSSSNF